MVSESKTQVRLLHSPSTTHVERYLTIRIFPRVATATPRRSRSALVRWCFGDWLKNFSFSYLQMLEMLLRFCFPTHSPLIVHCLGPQTFSSDLRYVLIQLLTFITTLFYSNPDWAQIFLVKTTLYADIFCVRIHLLSPATPLDDTDNYSCSYMIPSPSNSARTCRHGDHNCP